MKRAAELINVPPHYAIWQLYDPAVKAELFSTAVRIEKRNLAIDPIPLAAEARLALGDVAAVFLTNANHARAAANFPAPIFVPSELANEFPHACNLTDGMQAHGLTVIAIDGAAPGECAFYDERDRGTLIVGDALINFEPHGFTILPAKYCTDRKRMIRSLRRVLDLPFARIFFAHGPPITNAAHERLATVLDESP